MMDEIRDLQDLEDLKFVGASFLRRPKVYKARINPLDEYDEEEFRRRYRFSKQSMRRIIDIFKDSVSDYEYEDLRGGAIPVDLQIMMAIRYWGCNEGQLIGAKIHGCSQSTISNVAAKCAHVIASKAGEFIYMPRSKLEEATIKEEFEEIRGFPHVIGAIDCLHIKWKRYPAINTQVVCGPDLKIMDLVAHWQERPHDTNIFSESSIGVRFESGDFHGVLLGSSEYPCTTYLLTPILNPTNEREVSYNQAHIHTRNTIKHCFDQWRNRFQIIRNGFRCALKTAEATIVATAVLFNLSIMLNDTLDDLNEDILDDHPDEVMETESNDYNGFIQRNFIDSYFHN